MDETERQEIVRLREEIAALEDRLRLLYAWREVKILLQVRKHAMTYREIASSWNISEPRVSGIVKKVRSRERHQ